MKTSTVCCCIPCGWLTTASRLTSLAHPQTSPLTTCVLYRYPPAGGQRSWISLHCSCSSTSTLVCPPPSLQWPCLAWCRSPQCEDLYSTMPSVPTSSTTS
ncbi:hypothetical protein DPMN_163714 [Dreissena polymorpha]|uniref:Uncharacterized protein n=1 Tax=Dreissena polymorpha TaxID=45954 RepID=A0A9D4EWB7_DREPO|nr:hypothetical protein DPMN_163714 [Dreissena polymorpha]